MEPSAEYDSPWKEILEEYFEDFIIFFFPKAHKDIDWKAGYTFLDKELEKVVRDAELGTRRVDKLARVQLKNGQEAYVLVHIEIQGQYDSGFTKRMYVYNYRLFDRYDKKIVSLAILTDDRKKWKPHKYGYELWDFKVSIEFPVIKLLDYSENFDILLQNNNPFAIVVMAHLKTMETRTEPAKRFRWKFNIIKMLYQRGYSKQAVLNLLRFIDWIMALPEEMDRSLNEKIAEYQEENKMRYVTSFERIGIEKGLQKGLQKETKLIALQLKTRFGAIPKWVEKKLSAAATEDLETWGVRLLSAKDIEDVFA